jgi:excisionase family DNA binding protein
MKVQETEPLPRLVSVHTLSEILDVSESKLYSLATKGEIPSVRIGKRSIRFNVADVMAALPKKGATA